MDLQNFKAKVLEIATEANNLFEVISNSNHIAVLNDFIETISDLVEFVEDEKNLVVLDEAKRKNDTDIQPLDNICKNILVKLNDVDGLLKKEIFDFMRPENNTTIQVGVRTMARTTYNSQALNDLNNKMKDQGLKKLLSAYEILKHLNGHYKTLIILGPNGSGKTSFANHIKGVDNHVKVIPASKPIMATGYIKDFQQMKL